MANTITDIPVGLIGPNPENPRKRIDAAELTELAESIKSVGLLQPITVRLMKGRAGRYQIVCGHRRYMAAKEAGLETVSCIVRELTDEQAYELMVTENLQRKDIDPFEESEAFCGLRGRGYDTEALAAKFGKSRTYILSRLRLESLIPEFRKLYEDGEVDFSHCNILARCDIHLQARLYGERYFKDGYQNLKGKTVADLKGAISSMSNSLKGAIFDTSACAQCPHNSASWNIFPDGTEFCEDGTCFECKTLDAEISIFNEVRKHNPDVFILDDWSIPKNGHDKTLLDRLLKEGYIVRKENDPNAYEDCKQNGGRWKIDPTQKITCFSFGWKGWCGPVREVCKTEAPKPWKNEWQLNYLAENREEKLKDYEQESIRENIALLTNVLRENWKEACRSIILDFVLEVLWNNVSGDIEQAQLKNDMEPEDARETIQTKMMGVDKWLALLKWALAMDDDDHNADIERFQILLPAAFEDTDKTARRKFYDAARECFKNYTGPVTDEMIDAELAERKKK